MESFLRKGISSDSLKEADFDNNFVNGITQKVKSSKSHVYELYKQRISKYLREAENIKDPVALDRLSTLFLDNKLKRLTYSLGKHLSKKQISNVFKSLEGGQNEQEKQE